jgi:hypothetical protein
MALPVTRSVVRELDEGLTDGRYKKVVTDRGGLVEDGFWENRKHLSVKMYGIVEAPTKVLPGANGMEVTTPYTVPTKDPENLGY